MKKLIITTMLLLSTSAFAKSVTVFNFDEVDSISVNGKTALVEDLRDGFSLLNGVLVNESNVTITSESKAHILLKNSNKFLPVSTMAAKIVAGSGGDSGGG